eukprot:3581839-Pyramimonas_sp.AAC.2
MSLPLSEQGSARSGLVTDRWMDQSGVTVAQMDQSGVTEAHFIKGMHLVHEEQSGEHDGGNG